ncbi:MAG: hypothetical protein ACRDRN_14900 [Sciscionella sp.]
MTTALLVLAVFVACAVEAVEALTIVLAVGLRWRTPPLRGVASYWCSGCLAAQGDSAGPRDEGCA